MKICKHDDNKAYATPSKTDVVRIGTTGTLFTQSIDTKILFLMCNYRLSQFAERRSSIPKTLDLIDSFEKRSFSNHIYIYIYIRGPVTGPVWPRGFQEV
jgi:hypothetical protein